MARFLLFRMLYMCLVVIGISILVFTLSRMSGDPRYLYMTPGSRWSEEVWEARGRALGLDKPLVMQYLIWAGRAVRGNFGESVWHKRNSLDVIRERAPATIKLSGIAYVLALPLGISLGVVSAVKRGTMTDLGVRGLALVGQAAPPFFLALALIVIFAVQLNWLPTSRMGGWTNYVLPVFTLVWLAAAGLARITRSAMLEVLDTEYIKLARAKGVGRSKVILKHGLKNALIAPLTVAAILFANFLTGTVVVETVFAWPGLGRLAVDATLNNDFPLVTGLVVIFTLIYLFSSLAADLFYAVIDPRIRVY